jgi:hypothetical protein
MLGDHLLASSSGFVKKRQTADLSTTLRFGRDDKFVRERDDKGRVALPRRVMAGRKAIFITLGGPQAHDLSGRDDKFLADS